MEAQSGSGTLAAMPWQVVVDADAVGDDAARQALAEAQRQKLVELLGNVENLRAALTHLGMADFRGVAALELTGNEERMRWEVIEPWLLCRPNLAGPIMYNERAEDTPAHPELLERERVILRTAEPIDLPAMFLLTAKHHGTQAWDAFLDTFGIPSIFLETPPNTTEEQAQEYQQKVEEIVGEGRGTIPSGAKFHTVETGQKETKSFQERADWCKNALLILATGGLLTITAQSGSGTLAGNAHADSFERLCAATAQDISTVVDFQFCRPSLQSIFPGQPILAHFELAPEKEEDLAAQAQIIATLAGAGFKPSAEVVSEMMGFEVAAVEQQADLPLTNDHRPMTNSAASQHVMNRKAATTAPQGEPPLTDDELAAFATLATPNPARMAQRQREVEAALRAAADLPEGTAEPITNSEDECRAADPEHCRVHGEAEDDDREPWEKRQEEREHLEELMAELDRQEEAARDAEASGDPAHYNEEAARDRWSSLSREGDPQTREDIEKRLGELERADRADEIRKTEAGKTIQATLDSLKERKAGESPSAEHHLLDKVDSDTVDEVKKICGRDVSGYSHSISAAGLSHAKNRHPYLTDDDIMLLPDITSSYDSIKYEHSKSKGARLCYAKTYGGTTFEVVERIGRSNTRQSQQRLYFVTEYIAKHPADQQKPK